MTHTIALNTKPKPLTPSPYVRTWCLVFNVWHEVVVVIVVVVVTN